MFVILAYDVDEKRVAKVLKVARKYLVWVQNSLLEGDISSSQLSMLKMELREVTENTDRVRFYLMKGKKYMKIEDLYDGDVDSRENFIV